MQAGRPISRLQRNRKHDDAINLILGAGPALVWAGALAISALCGGCHAGPSLEFVAGKHRAEVAIERVVSPAMRAYVEADTTLARTTREDYLGLLQDWRTRLSSDSAAIATAEENP